MQTTYSEVSKYWAVNPCSGGNKGFPFNIFKGKRILEVGCGTGVDTQRFIKAGAFYTGIDLIAKPPHIIKMNAERLDFPDDTFDLVYSFGVIHHTLNPDIVMDEIYRVLKPEGFLFVMLYNKFSFRYLIEIMFLRKILWLLNYPRYIPIKKKTPHPTKQEWVSMNTDNLGCPMARVYTKKDTEILLKNFHITKAWTENWGWFRMIIARK